MTLKLSTKELSCASTDLRAGTQILLSGEVYTARDAAHKRIAETLKQGGHPPFEIKGAVIYYAGPTPSAPGKIIGSCGPTTSSRMDTYTPALYDMGLAATIGKGPRSKEVVESIVKNKAIYLLALGGIGALAASCITDLQVIAYDDLGCESVKKLTFKDFPLYVGIDSSGNFVFN